MVGDTLVIDDHTKFRHQSDKEMRHSLGMWVAIASACISRTEINGILTPEETVADVTSAVMALVSVMTAEDIDTYWTAHKREDWDTKEAVYESILSRPGWRSIVGGRDGR